MRTMMALGAFRFSMDTAAYKTLAQREEYRWASQERIGRHPAMQFIGAGHTTITLDGEIYPHFRGGVGQVPAMRAMAGGGVPLILVSGAGNVFGSFVIMSVDETQTVFFADGTPRKVEFSVELKSYGLDGAGALGGFAGIAGAVRTLAGVFGGR